MSMVALLYPPQGARRLDLRNQRASPNPLEGPTTKVPRAWLLSWQGHGFRKELEWSQSPHTTSRSGQSQETGLSTIAEDHLLSPPLVLWWSRTWRLIVPGGTPRSVGTRYPISWLRTRERCRPKKRVPASWSPSTARRSREPLQCGR